MRRTPRRTSGGGATLPAPLQSISRHLKTVLHKIKGKCQDYDALSEQTKTQHLSVENSVSVLKQRGVLVPVTA